MKTNLRRDRRLHRRIAWPERLCTQPHLPGEINKNVSFQSCLALGLALCVLLLARVLQRRGASEVADLICAEPQYWRYPKVNGLTVSTTVPLREWNRPVALLGSPDSVLFDMMIDSRLINKLPVVGCKVGKLETSRRFSWSHIPFHGPPNVIKP